ncbi:hypothetical protein EV421DRAFT_2080105 [Armillaria borealis]|uniref:BTB domain-containing protein n=1 Tax=Armillaria borealis TaxID=47425 RepID=A0AA39JNC7_9AGAR|nr:hypothetical protein EV421DRAFT_2080105 [Armillaria borealis]
MDNSYSFDGSDTTADVILISCNNIRLYAHKFILSLASPFFKDMFALAQAPTDGTLPTVPMAEDGETIGQILRFCYPIKDPSFEEISALYRVMVVMARKYLMEDLVIRARSELRKFSDAEPLRVFAIAYAMGWKEEATTAANMVLERPSSAKDDDDIPELDLLQSPRIIYRLLKFCEKRLDEALNKAFIDPDEVRISFQSKPSCSAHSLYQYDGEDGPPSTVFRRYLGCFAMQHRAAIRNRPTWETVRIVESHLRYEAKETAWTCPECNICDLPSLFDRFIPEVYLERIQRALSRKFCL